MFENKDVKLGIKFQTFIKIRYIQKRQKETVFSLLIIFMVIKAAGTALWATNSESKLFEEEANVVGLFALRCGVIVSKRRS